MNYYEHHIGDYASATSHLTFVEDAAYSRLIRRYYSTEAPLPADVASVQRLVSARSREEKAAVEAVLREFFTLQDDGWHQARCDEELDAYNVKRQRSQRNGKLGGRPAKLARRRVPHGPEPSSNPNETQQVISGLLDTQNTETQTKGHQTPDTSNQSKDKKNGAARPFVLPEWIDPIAWQAFDEMRKRIRKPMTDRARELIVLELDRLRALGHQPAALLDKSTRNSWQDVYEPRGTPQAGGMVPGGQTRDYRAGVGPNGRF